MLNENAVTLWFLGVQVYAWGLYVAVGAALACACMFLRARNRLPKGAAALVCALSVAVGFVCSRLFYCAFDEKLRLVFSLRAVFIVTAGGYSMFGAIMGCFLAAWLSGKALKVSTVRILDLLFPCLFLFIALERLGEGSIEGFGISRPLVSNVKGWNLFIYHGEYEDYLATYMLESLMALVLFALTVRRAGSRQQEGDVTLRCMLLLGLTQVLMESLRFDQHMRFSFVGMQQILFMCLAAAALFIRCAQLKKLRIAIYICLPCLVGLLVLLEFLIDRSGYSKVLLYVIYVLLLLVPLYLGMRAAKEVHDGRKAG